MAVTETITRDYGQRFQRRLQCLDMAIDVVKAVGSSGLLSDNLGTVAIRLAQAFDIYLDTGACPSANEVRNL